MLSVVKDGKMSKKKSVILNCVLLCLYTLLNTKGLVVHKFVEWIKVIDRIF